MAKAKESTKQKVASKTETKVSDTKSTKVKPEVKSKAQIAQKQKTEKSEVASVKTGSDTQTLDVKPQDSTPTAKAGKRSAKSIAEAEEKEAKEARKVAQKEVESEKSEKPKVQAKPARPRIERQGKKFRKAAELIEKGKLYSLKDALDLAVKTSPVKFDASVELHVRLGVDPKQADQNLRDTVILPAGTGKTQRIAVFAEGDNIDKAKKAGADIAAGEEFLQQLDKGTLDFDVLIATPASMPKLGKYARLLGPKGLMPNPKSGTVTPDVAKAVSEAKAGRVEYRVDSTGIVHTAIGKVSFGADKLLQNGQAILASIKANKPGSLKSVYVRSIFVTTSMGPSIPTDNSEL